MIHKKLFQHIVLISLGFFLSFLFLEIIVRFLLPITPSIYTRDSKTDLIILRPDKEFIWKKSCFKNKVVTNSFGFHAPEFNIEKKSDELRIVVLGDSYVEALQIPLDKTFSMILEKYLNQDKLTNKKVVVYPIGISGNGTYLNYLYYLNYARKLKPDIVILAFLFGNDFRDDSDELSQIYLKQTGDFAIKIKPQPKFDLQGNLIISTPLSTKIISGFKNVLRKSRAIVFLYNQFVQMKTNYFIKKSEQKEELGFIPIDNQVSLKNYPDYWENAWLLEKKLLQIFKETVEKDGSKFILVSLTEHWRVDKNALRDYSWYNQLDLDKPEKMLSEIAKDLKITYFPLLPYLRMKFEKEKLREVFECDGHWNEIGHKWAAEALLQFFEQNKNILK